MADPRPDSAAAPAEILVVGANHRSSDAELRERLHVVEDEVPDFLGRLRDAGIAQCQVMSTCDRVEVQAAHVAPDAAAAAIAGALADGAGEPAAALRARLYHHTGADAVRHIFAVAASLDSVIVGEPQVLGQLKESHARAADIGTTGAELEAVLQAGYACAKRVRSETDIAIGAVSLAATAVQVARDIHGDPAAASALLLGSGDLGVLLVDYLRRAGLARLVVAAPSPARAEIAARRHACRAVTHAQLAGALAEADIVVAAAGIGRWLIDAAMLEAALAQRNRRPVFLLDVAVPGDVDPAVDALDGAFRYTIDDLETVAQASRHAREAAAAAAWRIVDEQVAAFEADRAARGAVPTLVRLRAHFEAARRDVLARADGADADEATRLLVNRLLHDPYAALRAAAGDDDDALSRAAARLFALADDGAAR